MQRRRLLGWGGAAVLAAVLAGAGAASLRPAIRRGLLTADGQILVNALGQAILQGSLPEDNPAVALALTGLQKRFEELVQALPAHTQSDIEEMLVALNHPAGCRALMGHSIDWATASPQQVQTALTDMQKSDWSLRRQAYLALHDLIGGAYFAAPQTWAILGYPGPMAV